MMRNDVEICEGAISYNRMMNNGLGRYSGNNWWEVTTAAYHKPIAQLDPRHLVVWWTFGMTLPRVSTFSTLENISSSLEANIAWRPITPESVNRMYLIEQSDMDECYAQFVSVVSHIYREPDTFYKHHGFNMALYDGLQAVVWFNSDEDVTSAMLQYPILFKTRLRKWD